MERRLALALAVLVGCRAATPEARVDAPPGDAAVPRASLAIDRSLEARIGGTSRHCFAIPGLDSGDLVDLLVEQRGVNVRLLFLAPSGEILEEVDRRGPQGNERLYRLASETGDHQVCVEPTRKPSRTGGYRIHLARPAPADDVERERARVWSLLWRARRRSLAAGKDLPATRGLWAEAREGARALGDRRFEAHALVGWARTESLLGGIARSRELFVEARRAYAWIGDRGGEAEALFGQASAAADAGDLEESLALYGKAVAAFSALTDDEMLGRALHNIGTVYVEIDEPREALRHFERAQEAFARAGDPAPVTRMERGGVYHRLGDAEQALVLLEEARRQLSAQNLIWDAATALDMEARVYLDLLGDPGTAQARFEEALALHRRAGDRNGEAAAQNGLGMTLASRGDWAASLAAHREAARLTSELELPLGRAEALLGLARSLSLSGQPREAAAVLDSVEPLVVHLRSAELRVDLRGERVRVAMARGDTAAALRQTRAALLEIELVRARIPTRELRTSHLASRRHLFVTAVDLLLSGDPDPGRVAEAFAIAESSRARALLEALGSELPAPRRADPATVASAQERSRALRLAEARHLTLLSLGAPDAQVEAAAAGAQAAFRRYREAEAEMRRGATPFEDLAARSRTRPTDVQRLLDRDTALLSYFVGPSGSYAWLVTRSEIRFVRLAGQDRLAAAVTELHRELVARQDVTSSARRLSDLILAPLGPVPARRWLIVADAALAYVPFAVLPVPGGGPDDLVLDHVEVTLLPSASALLARGHPPEPAPERWASVILADPVYDARDGRVGDAAAPSSPFARLRFSRDEAGAIAPLFPTTPLVATDFAASRETLTSEAARRAPILHIATHALLDTAHPDLSALVLSLVDAQGRPRDGLLRLHEIYRLDLSASLVVLSGCETALGREVKGEGLVGLARGFLFAGAERVLASLWQIHDRGTAVLMTAFYRELFEHGRSPAAALREAQLALRRSARFSHPYYWAAFVLSGTTP